MKYVIKRKKDGKYWNYSRWFKDIQKATVFDYASHGVDNIIVRVRIEEVKK